MIEPNFPEFKKRSGQKGLVAISTTILADLETPVSLFLKLAKTAQEAFLFESAEIHEKIGRYSVLGMDPIRAIEIQEEKVKLIELPGRKVLSETKIKSREDVFRFLRHELKSMKQIDTSDLPGFVGAYVGFFGYEFVRYCDDIPIKKASQSGFPDGILMLFQSLVVYDHLNHSIKLIRLADGSSGNLTNEYRSTSFALKKMERTIKNKKLKSIETPKIKAKAINTLKSNLTQKQFESNVKTAKEYIKSGDCIQIVLSQRLDLGRIQDDFLIYRTLRTINPSPYMFYFRSRDLRLIGSSPETLVKKIGNQAETKPIAGTRPRGVDEREDQKLELNLKKSVKELAEHIMLVDLGRNDLGRVCKSKSVHVSEFAKVERYSHVMHLVSTVQGELASGKTALDLLQASFPAGTVTGAPKIRAMQIIDELEKTPRGPYAGAVGYFGSNGDMDFCITIRTLVSKRNHVSIQAGAGIVNDSKPTNEYYETLNKAKALTRAFALAKAIEEKTK